jgi:type IV pilus assembly protein PilY1
VSGVLQLATAWEAANLLTGTSGSRRIFVGKTSGSVVPSTFEFNSTNVTLNELCAGALSRCIGTGTGRTSISGGLGITNSQAIAYLRGDQTLEASSTTPLRKRSRVLGDIVNSTPVVISPFNDYGYRSLRGTSPGSTDPYNYAAYLETKKTRPQMVFVGANDGMLHAFRGDSGVEQFAYIPAAALGHMGNLLFPYRVEDKNDQVFQHRYFVDGPIVVSDAHVGSGWKTTLVGTLGAGGKGVFGLDVSTPGTFAASNVMFDINDKASTAAIRDNIGHVLSRPVIVPVKVGANVRWKAIFGNGYNSTNNRAVLFIVDLANPTGAGGVVMVEATEASQTEANGLGGIIAVDRFVGSTTTAGRDGYADTVYGADQNGAIWKFDLRSSTPAALTTPFFTATDASGARQAITGGLEAAAGPRGGVMLYFGTGSFSFVNDPADRQVQSFYGVLDTGTPVSRAELHEQSIILDEDGNRDTTMLPMPANKKGWFIDLRVGATATGERMVGTPRVESGIIFFPAFDPTSTDGCATGGTNRLYGLAALSGAAAMSSVRQGSPTGEAYGEPTGAVKLSTTGSAPVTDIAIMTSPRTSPLAAGTTDEDLDDALGARCSMVVRAPGSDLLYLRRPCGRQSWRQVR